MLLTLFDPRQGRERMCVITSFTQTIYLRGCYLIEQLSSKITASHSISLRFLLNPQEDFQASRSFPSEKIL